MADDPYKTLGVARDATEKQIRKAYLKLAKSTHPDLHPGDAKAEERFKAVTAANDLLSDAERRGRFDRGEIDAAGHERPPPGQYRTHAEQPSGARYGHGFGGAGPGFGRAGPGFGGAGPVSEDDLGDILSGMFGARRGGSMRGQDRRYSLAVPFLDAVRGTTQRLVLPEGGSLDVRIPAGLESGQVLRLRGKGGAGEPPGDAMIEVEVGPHPVFRREGRDIYLDLPISISEAVLGGRVTVPTIEGAVTMMVPAGSDAGTRLRLRGRGVPASGALPAGDAYATLRIVLGPADEGLAAFLRERADAPEFDPRKGLEDAA